MNQLIFPKFLKAVLSFIAISRIVVAGSIQSYDLQMDYSNLGYTSQYSILFQISTTTLDSTKDAIRVIFPSLIHNPSISVTSSISSATLSYLDTSTPPVTQTLTASKIRVDSYGRYYFYFGSTFLNTNLYTLTIQSTSLGAPLAQSLVTQDSILQIETIMDYTADNTFIYDFNPNFGVIRYTSAPEKNIQFIVDATISDYAFNPGAVYPVFFTIITSKAYYGNVRFEISFIPSGFSLTQICYSVQDTQISAIEPTLYNCYFSNNKLIFEYHQANIASGFAFKIASIAQNSNSIVTNIGYKLRVILMQGSHITDEVTQENLYAISQLFLTSTQVNVAYGIPIDTQISPNFLICLIRSTNQSTISSIFNALNFIFQINLSTPAGQELELHFQVPSSSGLNYDSYILVQSISENLPNLSSTLKVVCTVVNNFVSTGTRYIRCINVGQLVAGTSYQLGFRIYLQYDNAQSSLPSNFSELDIFPVYYPNGVRTLDTTPLNLQQTITSSQVRTQNANSWSYSQYNQTVVSTQPYNAASSAFNRPYLSGGTLGIVPSSNQQQLIFSLDIPNVDLTTRNMSLPQTVPYSSGVQIAVNPKIQFSNNPAINSYSLLNSNITLSINYTNNYFTLLLVSASTTDALSKLFTRNDFSISPVTINFRATPYAIDSLLDFYIMSYDQFLSGTPTLGGQYLANAYTVDFSVPNSNYKLGIINQYKGTTFGNIPSVVPTLLMLSITFSSNDVVSGNQGLIIFFDGGSFIDDVNYKNNESTAQIISCGTSITATTTSYLGYRTIQTNGTNQVNHGLIYQNMNQLVISNFTLTAGSSVTIILPMRLHKYSDEFQVYVATMELNANYKLAQKSNYYTYDVVYRLSASSQNQIESNSNIHRRLLFGNQMSSNTSFPNDSLFPTITKNTIGFQSLNTVGSIVTMTTDLKFTDSDQTYLFTNDNSQSYLQGAAFTLITSWKFYNTQSNSGCYFFSYSYNTTATPPVTSQKYVMYCPLSTTDTTTLQQVINNFQIPQTSITTPADTTFALSNARGYLRYAYILSQNIANPNVLSAQVITGNLYWGSVDNLIKYSVLQPNSAIPLQSGMKVSILQAFKNQYITAGLQCMFYDPTTLFYEMDCTVGLNAASPYQIDFYLGSNCSQCTFTSTFVIYHYGNAISSSGNSNADKTFSVTLCLPYVSNGVSQCQQLATTVTIFFFLLIFIIPILQFFNSQLNKQTTSPTYTFQAVSASTPPKLNINTYQITLSHLTTSQMNTFSLSFGFNFNSITGVQFNGNIFDRIVFNLGTFGVNNQQLFDPLINTRICQIFQDNGNGNTQLTSLFSSFSSISSNSGGSLLLALKADLQSANNFVLQCSNVRLPQNTIILPINLVVQDYLYSTVYQQSNGYTFSPLPTSSQNFALGYPLITSILGNSQGSLSSIFFQVRTTSTKFLNNLSTIYITLPFNYDINYTLKFSFACKVNSIRVDCFLDSWNTLRLSGIAQQVSNLLSIVISGVSIPKYNQYAYYSFLVIFDYTNPTVYEEGVASSINESVVTTLPLVINSMLESNLILDELAIYSFYLTLNATLITSQTFFQINFPSIWSITNDEEVSQCIIQDVEQSNILGQFCRREGSIVSFKIYSGNVENLSSTSSSALSTILLSVTNINNPQNWSTNIQFIKPAISLIDSVTGATIYYGDSYLLNSQSLTFSQQTGLQYLGWFDINGNQLSQVNAINGVLQTQLYLRPLNTALSFQGQISISLSQTSLKYLAIFPTTPLGSIGDVNLPIFIGANPNTRQGSYVAMFYKVTDPFALYANIPSISNLLVSLKIKQDLTQLLFIQINLVINVSNTIVPINYSILKLKMQLGGISPPIVFDLSNQRIINSISVQAVSNSDIEILKGATMNFDQFTSQNIFQFQVNENTNDSTFTIQFTTSGPGSSFIQASNKVSVEIDVNDYQYTKLSVSIDPTQVGPTSQPVGFTCNNIGVIYYRISQIDQPAATIAQLKSQGIASYINYENQYNLVEQYGYAISNAQMVTVTMNNLLSIQYYKIEAYCETFKGIASDKITQSFQTSDNDSRLNQFTIQFKQNLTDTQKRKLCCIISEFLTVPFSLVYLREGTKCKDTQLRVSFITPQPIKSSQYASAVVYIAPLDYLPNISEFSYMQSAIANTQNFKQILQNYIPSLPQIASISGVVSIDYASVHFDLSVPDQITQGYTNVTISNLKLQQNGFIYLALEELSAQSITPEVSQLQRGVNYEGTVFQHGMKIIYQNSLVYKSSSFYFDQLKNNTNYVAYFMGGSEYQDDLTTYTQVYTRQFQTLSLTQSINVEVVNTSALKISLLHLALLILVLAMY